MREILDNNPGINPAKIELFHQVYYPIAQVEVSMDEKLFGDFETVEKTVLELLDAGFSSTNVLAKLLGVPEIFVQNILKILLGYGHIDKNNCITELGKHSLKANVRITEVLTKQIVSIDAVGGLPMNIDKSVVSREMVNPTDVTDSNALVIPSATQATAKAFLNAINQNSNIQALCKKQQLININVTGIREARLISVEYASAFFMYIKNASAPYLFLKMYDPSKEAFRERFSWRPVQALNRLQPAATGTTLQNLLQEIQKQQGAENNNWAVQLLHEEFEKRYLVDRNYVTIDPSCTTCTLSAKAFTTINLYALNVLLGFGKQVIFVYTNDRIHGKVFHLLPDSSIPLSHLKKLEKKVGQEGFQSVLEQLSALQEAHTDPFAAIAAYLNEA